MSPASCAISNTPPTQSTPILLRSFLELVLPSNQLVLKQLKQKEMHLNPPVTDTFLLLAKLIAKHIEIVRRSRAHIETLLLRYDRSQLIAFLCP